MPAISDARILIIATDGFEDSELLEPRKRLLEAGAHVTLASPATDQIKGEHGALLTPDKSLADIAVGERVGGERPPKGNNPPPVGGGVWGGGCASLPRGG